MTHLAAIAERVWYGRDPGAAAARVALAPLGLLFRSGVAVRQALYDRSLLRVESLPLPAASVGNLTVGGTGKTPVAAWLAGALRDRGARPALVLRGVGGDEPQVHALLNPDVPVVTGADRVAGVRAAAALGADVVVLDDAFQHRRARRDVDLVLVSAERFDADRVRLLPAGPYREGLAALRRAAAVIVTRKSASAAQGAAVRAALADRVPVAAQVHLVPDRLRRWEGAPAALAQAASPGEVLVAALRGERVLAITGIGEPGAFVAQLQQLGARVESAAYADHHAFSPGDVAALVRRAQAADRVVCTLKDAVKLGPQWPHLAPPLWYVTQRVAVEHGADELDRLVARLLAMRPPARMPRAADAPPPARPGTDATAPRAPASPPAGPNRRE